MAIPQTGGGTQTAGNFGYFSPVAMEVKAPSVTRHLRESALKLENTTKLLACS
jgi:hypothetical protein